MAFEFLYRCYKIYTYMLEYMDFDRDQVVELMRVMFCIHMSTGELATLKLKLDSSGTPDK